MHYSEFCPWLEQDDCDFELYDFGTACPVAPTLAIMSRAEADFCEAHLCEEHATLVVKVLNGGRVGSTADIGGEG